MHIILCLLLLLASSLFGLMQNFSDSMGYTTSTNYENGIQQLRRQQQEHEQMNSFDRRLLLQQYSNNADRRPSHIFLLRSHETISNSEQNKCRIWVPSDSVSKYALASLIQVDQSNQLSLIEVCCTGYSPIRMRGITSCRPICGCANGNCRVPGECNCYEGFVKSDNNDCVFTCPLGCLNGRCFLDGSCQCDPGYKLDKWRKFCRPICSNGCGNNPHHNCTEPGVCSCAKNFQLTDDGCQPICDPECGIGGFCRANNMCDCEPGYTLKDGICQSDCYQKCNNGVCVSRNRCICNRGFSYHEHSTMCVPL